MCMLGMQIHVRGFYLCMVCVPQGDHAAKLVEVLVDLGYNDTKKSGGK